MKRLLIALLIIPTLLLGQDKQKKTTVKTKVDAWKGATKNEVKFTGYISGKVKDTDNNKALEYATISLIHKKNNKLIEGTITDNKGRFHFKEINVGEYIIGISFIGLCGGLIPYHVMSSWNDSLMEIDVDGLEKRLVEVVNDE